MSQISTLHKETFRNGSKTYYNSSVFFPEDIKEDVHILYGFVRIADNLVDRIPQDREGFIAFKNRYSRALGGERTGDEIIDSFVELHYRKRFDEAWTEAFLHSMELDLTKRVYHTIEETLEYIFGSAEVIGLFMSRILDLDPEAHFYAQLQGRSMQYINFIRDIDEDRSLGRSYLPLEDSESSLLTPSGAKERPVEFVNYVRRQIALYIEWQEEAEKGYRFIPKRYRVPIKTASDMYNWTAKRIEQNPFLIFETKVKPPKGRILLTALYNIVVS